MSSRRLRPLTATDLSQLPDPCSACAFWEASLSDLATSPDHRDRAQTKLDWAEAVTARWGYCGVLAVSDGEIVGFLTMAPAGFVPRLAAFATTPVSQDAAVLMSVRVVEHWQGKGLGRQLIQSAAGLAARRDIRALEAVGTNHDGPSCMLPASWLQSVGFAVVRPHPMTPRMRMDLQASVRWKPTLGAAWQKLTALVPQPSTPEPAGFEPISRASTPVTGPGPAG
ncbi:MAG TPA: GNAT family N-acetyltransferase [Propionibacteriaceae bacterium]